MNDPAGKPSTATTKGLEHLKVVLQHILHLWPRVLQRRHYLRAMSQSEDLRQAIAQTYAAHVHNTLHAVLSVDLVRDVGALILDNDPRSASLARAVQALRVEDTMRELRDAYAVIPPMQAADAATVQAMHKLESNERQLHLDRHLPAELDAIQKEVLSIALADKIRTVRNKVVAHYDVVHDGANWKMWEVTGVGLTYGQLDEYIDRCTEAVDRLCGYVLRAAFAFDELPRVSERYALEYIEALIIGLNRQKELDAERRAANQRRMRELLEGNGPHTATSSGDPGTE